MIFCYKDSFSVFLMAFRKFPVIMTNIITSYYRVKYRSAPVPERRLSMKTEEKLSFFKELVQCIYKIPFSVYAPDMHLQSTDAPSPEIFGSLFMMSSAHTFLMEHMESSDFPIILSNSLGLMWTADFEKEKNETVRIYIMGPVFISMNPTSNLEAELDRRNIAVSLKMNFLRQMKLVPVVPAAQFFQFSVMLHDCLTGRKISVGDLQHQDTRHREPAQKDPDSIHADLHPGINNAEEELMRMVQEGNMDYKEIFVHASNLSSGVKASISSPVQLAKYTAVTFLALVSRAAIRGGLPAPTAYTLNDLYTEQIDACKTLSDLTVLNGTMYNDFVYRVHKCRADPSVSKPVRSCCDTIDMHIKEKIGIEQLAQMTGYSSYYLSRKFKTETGQSIHSYINKAKIDYAKMLLSSTRISIQEISDQLNFCSRSYFTDQFLKIAGMPPSLYREKYSTV